MKRFYFYGLLLLILASCTTPNVYNIYKNHNADPNFTHTQLSGEVVALGSFLIPKKDKATKRILQGIKSVDIIQYNTVKSTDFSKEFFHSLQGAYQKIEKNGQTFYIKRKLGKVKEFHTFTESRGVLSIFSVNGDFSIFDLEKAYRLIKKQQSLKGFMKKLQAK